MLKDLILINLIVVLIWRTDFFPTIDEWISKRIRFHHLPKPFFCSLCGCWWLSLLYIICTGNLSLMAVAICIVSASLTTVTEALWGMMENMLFTLIGIINRLTDYIR